MRCASAWSPPSSEVSCEGVGPRGTCLSHEFGSLTPKIFSPAGLPSAAAVGRSVRSPTKQARARLRRHMVMTSASLLADPGDWRPGGHLCGLDGPFVVPPQVSRRGSHPYRILGGCQDLGVGQSPVKVKRCG